MTMSLAALETPPRLGAKSPKVRTAGQSLNCKRQLDWTCVHLHPNFSFMCVISEFSGAALVNLEIPRFHLQFQIQLGPLQLN